MEDLDRYEVVLRVADADEVSLYLTEHWFADRPGIETINGLFEEAKREFAELYPEAEAEDFAVEVRRLRAVRNGDG